MIQIYQKTIKEKELKTLENFRVGSWIYAESPTEEELERLAKEFSLELGHLKDAADIHEVPRLEIEKKTDYIFIRFPHQQEDGLITTTPLLIVLGENFLITVSQKRLPFLEKFITGKINFYTTQKTKLFLQIFSEVNSLYSHFLASINRRVRSIGVRIEKITPKDIVQFIASETILNDFMADLVPTNTILKNLLSGKILKLYEEDKDLTEDLLLSNNQLVELCKSNIKTIINIRDAYSTIMSNNINRVIKLLTSITIILTVPMIVASLYGMNVALPLENHPSAFWLILGIVGAISATLVYIFNKNQWL